MCVNIASEEDEARFGSERETLKIHSSPLG